MGFNEFTLGSLFDIHTPVKRFNANAVKFGGIYPYVARGSSNNGIRGYITEDVKYLNPGNTLSFGQDTATVFYQKEAYFTGDKIKIMELRDYELNENLALYLITSIRRAFSGFTWGQSSFDESVLNGIKVLLPAKEDGTPDWCYMSERIHKLEAERIHELEAYLAVTGLDNYELTEADTQVLEVKPVWKEFYIIDIFDVYNTKSILKEQIIPNSGRIPYVTAGEADNAVMTYVDCPKEWIDKGNCVFIGGKTMVVTYQKDDFCSNDSHNLALYLKETNVGELVYFYLVASVKKSLGHKYVWGDSISKKKIQSDSLKLPVNENDQPDWDYMERYICAMEKRAIAAVVKWKDRMVGEGLKGCQ